MLCKFCCIGDVFCLETIFKVASMSFTKRDSSQKKPLCYHDVVKMVKGNFLRYYAIITALGDLSKLNDDEVEINYLKKSFGKWAK